LPQASTELQLLLSMVTPLGWLERVPTYKEALENVKDKDIHTYGFLGYPILQASDIVMYGKAGKELLIPVGEDQKSHVELGREIVRRFNTFYGVSLAAEILDPRNSSIWRTLERPLIGPNAAPGPASRSREEVDALAAALRHKILQDGLTNFLDQNPVFVPFVHFEDVLTEPEAMLTQTPRIPGLDGRKMSKSYGNAITLSESDDSIRAKTKVMVTDPARKRRTDPGNPDVCPVYDWHKLFSPAETLKWSAEGCRSAAIGCIECKAAMAENLIKWIAPVRARREEYAAHPDGVLQILDEGSATAREVAQKTMARVREAVFNWKDKRAEIAAEREGAASSERASG